MGVLNFYLLCYQFHLLGNELIWWTMGFVCFLISSIGFAFNFCSFSHSLLIGLIVIYMIIKFTLTIVFLIVAHGLVLGFILPKFNWVLLQRISMFRLILEVMSCGSVAMPARCNFII